MAHTDYEIGRIVQRIKELGKEDNTLMLLMIGDNGASGEGTLQGLGNEVTFFNGIQENFNDLLLNMDDLGSARFYNHYPAGWAHAMNTPFQWVKQVASHYGGTRNPMIVSWPAKITEENHGQLREQWHHVIDVTPTILEVSREGEREGGRGGGRTCAHCDQSTNSNRSSLLPSLQPFYFSSFIGHWHPPTFYGQRRDTEAARGCVHALLLPQRLRP